MTSIDTLARTIADTHGIDTLAAARDAVTALVDQIADDPDLWNAETDELTDAGVELVSDAIAESYNTGSVATAAQHLLTKISIEAAALSDLEGASAERTMVRAELIRAALRTELRRKDIAAAARITPARMYQIRDGRR